MLKIISLIDIFGWVLYLLGYAIVSTIAYIKGDDHCLGYLIITSAITIHIIIIIMRYFARRRTASPDC